MPATHLHLYLPEQGDGAEWHVYLHSTNGEIYLLGDLGAVAESRQPAADVAVDNTPVEAMLKRFESFDPASPARAVASELARLGYVGSPPRARAGTSSAAAYIRWVYVGRVRKVTFYENSASLLNDADRERDSLLTLPGAEAHSRSVYFPFSSPDGVQNAIAAAQALKHRADGE